MNRMNVQKMNIENFKGIDSLEVPFGEHGVTIQGDNETGKSTIYDAFCYCLTGKNSEGETQFEIVPIGNPACSPSVEIEIELNGSPCTLKRVCSCKLDKRKDVTGYQTECYVNGVKKGVKEFDSFIEDNVASQDVIRLMVDTRYFTEHMNASKGLTVAQKQREMIASLVDVPTREDILFGNEETKGKNFTDLGELILRFKTVDEVKRFCKAQVKEIEEKSAGVQFSIEKYSKEVSAEYDGIREENLNEKIQEVSAEIESAKEERNTADHEYLVKVKEKMDASMARSKAAQTKLEDWRSAEQVRRISKANDAVKKCEKKEREASERMTKAALELSEKKDEIKKKISILLSKKEVKQEEISSLQRSYRKLKTEAENEESICPTCGQHIPDEVILKFKEERDEQIKSIVSAGKKAKEEVANVIEEIKHLKEEIQSIVFPDDVLNAVDEAKEELEKARRAYSEALNKKISDEEVPENIKKEVEEAAKEACSSLTGNDLSDELYSKKAEAGSHVEKLEAELRALTKELEITQKNNETLKFIKELEEEQEKLNRQYDDCQRIQDTVDELELIRLRILEERVNEKFSSTQWKLFEKQKNGEIVPCCVPTLNGKSYNSLSASTKTICNIEIVKAFQEHYGCKMPVFVDNAEGITEEIAYDGQIVSLYVREQLCPDCSGETGRKQQNGLWKCKFCGKEFKKTIEIKER